MRAKPSRALSPRHAARCRHRLRLKLQPKKKRRGGFPPRLSLGPLPRAYDVLAERLRRDRVAGRRGGGRAAAEPRPFRAGLALILERANQLFGAGDKRREIRALIFPADNPISSGHIILLRLPACG